MSKGVRFLWIIRTGETAWDVAGRLYGGEDLALSDEGRAATIEAIQRTPALARRIPKTIFTAPDEASTATAELIGAVYPIKSKLAPELVEPDLGVLAGLSVGELSERFERRARQWDEDPSDLMPPEGEPFPEARRRIVGGFYKVLKKARSETVGVVVHGFAGGFLRSALAGDPSGNPRRWMDGRPRIEGWMLPSDGVQRLAAGLDAR